jgi:putative transposase
VSYVEVECQISERHVCRLVGLGRSTYRYRARRSERVAESRERLKELAAKRMRFGYRRLTAMLAREVVSANHKRVYRSAVGDAGMRKASTGVPEQGTQAPSPAPDPIPAKTEKSTENLHRD